MSIEVAVVTIDTMGCQYEIAKKIIDKKGGLPLAPPIDWRRDTPLTFSCAHCRELSHFLADPAQKEWAFYAVQAGRSYVEAIIRSCKCDLDLTTLKKVSLHSLNCTKNQASYHQRSRQREMDLQILALNEAL